MAKVLAAIGGDRDGQTGSCRCAQVPGHKPREFRQCWISSEGFIFGPRSTSCNRVAVLYPTLTPAGYIYDWKRNKKVAIKHGFEGARELILAWNGWQVCASASPLGGQCHVFFSCLALIGALNRDAQKPFCYASMTVFMCNTHEH